MNAFLSALQSKTIQPAQTGNVINPKSVPPEVHPQNDKPEIRIELNSSRNRIDLFFSKIPSKGIREEMKQFNFRFNPDTKAWYNQDNESNREFCRREFGATLDTYEPIQPIIPLQPEQPPIVDSVPLAAVVPPKPQFELCETPVTPEFAKFRQQTNELLLQLQCEPADLMLLAIDCLHTKTFGGEPKN